MDIQQGDYALLNALNIDVRYPIFVYNKQLNGVFFQAFYNVKKKYQFNLILFEKPKISFNKLKKSRL